MGYALSVNHNFRVKSKSVFIAIISRVMLKNCFTVFMIKMIKYLMKTIDASDDFINNLNEDTKKLIDIEPAFMYKGQIIRLDFIGKADRLFLEKVFEEIEKDRNEKIDFDLLKREAEEVLEVQKNMAKIQAKQYISRKEYELIYGDSLSTQDTNRRRLYDPLPYHQKVEGGNILYKVDEVEQWRSNQHK